MELLHWRESARALFCIVGILAGLGASSSVSAQETHRATGRGEDESGPIHTTTVQRARIIAYPYLQQMVRIAEGSLAASRDAARAASVSEIKKGAAEVYASAWGLPPGEGTEALAARGWKERWQVSGAEFDSAFAARLGTKPPTVTDPTKLGIVGRGRAVRTALEAILADSRTSQAHRERTLDLLVTLQNVIGYMEMHDGVTKGERQPRVDLTRYWTAPSAFWNSTADTGWLFEAYSQAANILKTDYGNDVDLARQHAADMTRLIERYLNGVDADNDSVLEAIPMEGGLYTALGLAEPAGLASR